MNTEEKREKIIQLIEQEVNGRISGIHFSRPKLKGARVYVMTKEPVSSERYRAVDEFEALSNDHRQAPAVGSAETGSINIISVQKPGANDTTEMFADADVENMSPRQRKRFEKDLAKAKKKEAKEKAKRKAKEEKALLQMRKDIKKRGFETGVLYELNDPADIYELSNDEITQIEMAGVVNTDGYYNFVYPYDYESVNSDRIGKKTILIFIGFGVAIMLLTIALINSLSSIM